MGKWLVFQTIVECLTADIEQISDRRRTFAIGIGKQFMGVLVSLK